MTTSGFAVLAEAVRALAKEGILPRGLTAEALKPSATLEELGIDSLGRLALLGEIERRHGGKLPDATVARMRTLEDAVGLLDAARIPARAHDSSSWNGFRSALPIEALREDDLYFYGEAIESYGSGASVEVAGHGEMLMLGGYSYLDLIGHPRVNQAAIEAVARLGTGTHGVRMLAGTLDLHRRLERRLASFKGTEDAATFTSGYVANVSTVAALVGPEDAVLCDARNHASIVDGCRLSGARVVAFQHGDIGYLEECLRRTEGARRTLVVVDAVFSMDGDIIDLPEVSRLCRQHGALLMVDEAHSIGVLGRTGHGIEEHFGLPADAIDVKMGTLSKTIPSVGGYIAASSRLCDLLRHEARGFVYSGALAPPAAAAAAAAIAVIEDEPWRVERLHANARFMADRLTAAGIGFCRSVTPIFPIVCGEDVDAWKLARHCQREGIFVQAIPYPVVPKGTARLRVVVTAAHRTEDLERAVAAIERGARDLGIDLGDGRGSANRVEA